MAENEPKIDSNKSYEETREKNLTREKTIRSETEKVKKIVDLILKDTKETSIKKIKENEAGKQKKKSEKKESN